MKKIHDTDKKFSRSHQCKTISAFGEKYGVYQVSHFGKFQVDATKLNVVNGALTAECEAEIQRLIGAISRSPFQRLLFEQMRPDNYIDPDDLQVVALDKWWSADHARKHKEKEKEQNDEMMKQQPGPEAPLMLEPLLASDGEHSIANDVPRSLLPILEEDSPFDQDCQFSGLQDAGCTDSNSMDQDNLFNCGRKLEHLSLGVEPEMSCFCSENIGDEPDPGESSPLAYDISTIATDAPSSAFRAPDHGNESVGSIDYDYTDIERWFSENS